MSEHLIADIPQKAIILRDGRVLLELDKKGVWQLPGGRLNSGETPEIGLKREIHEELNLDIEPESIIHTFVFVSTSGDAHYVVMYICRVLSSLENLKVDPNEVRNIRWIQETDLDGLNMRDGYKIALRKFFKGV